MVSSCNSEPETCRPHRHSNYHAGVRQGTSWEDQWARIHRWRERVRLSRDEWRDDGLATEHYRDEVFALFQALWHLKDWFKNDTALPPTVGAAVERWIREEARLLHIAADVANGSKHMTLARGRAEGSSQTKNSVHVWVGKGVKHEFFVTDARDAQDYEAVALADGCLNEWGRFIADQGLVLPGND